MQRISSRHNPLVARCRAVARGESAALLLLDGVHLVSEAIAASIRIRQAIVSSAALDRAHIRDVVDLMHERSIAIAAASASVMKAISPVRSPSEIVAIADRPASDEALLYRSATPFVVIASDVQDPGNVGAIVRVAEAGGASGLIAAGGSADPLGWKALRGSMGSALRLPIWVTKDVRQAVGGAKRRGCRIVATVPSGGESLFGLDFRGAVAILIGGEGGGVAPDLIKSADVCATIPMQAPVESLNAAVAAALLIYEARRQRSQK